MRIYCELVEDIEFDGVDHNDYPDYSDVYISRCMYDGKEATESELDKINLDRDFVYETFLTSF